MTTVKSLKADVSNNEPLSERNIRNNRLDEGLMLETSAFKLNSLRWPIYAINSVGKTKLPCYTLPSTQHHSCFRNLLPFAFLSVRSIPHPYSIYAACLTYMSISVCMSHHNWYWNLNLDLSICFISPGPSVWWSVCQLIGL